MEDRRNA
jgi:drug/metabolite transporter (DMT)-like permease